MLNSKKFLDDNQVAGYWQWDVTGNNSLSNAELIQLLGYPENTPEHQSLIEQSMLYDDLQLSRIKMQQHIAEGGVKPYIHEARCRHRNGHIICFIRTGRIVFDEKDQPSYISGTFIDITCQKMAHQELLLARDFLSKTNEVALVGGWQLDLETNKVIWTDITRKIFGVPDDFVPQKGNSISFFKEGYDRERIAKAFNDAIEKGIAYDLELHIINTRGEQKWTRIIGTPEFENGHCVRLYGVFQDITFLKENEAALIKAKEIAESALEAKSRFLSIMSHEIRTPMNAVIGFTNLLLQDPRPDQQEYLNVLKFSAENLLVIIGDILDLNKIEAGKIILEDENFSLKNLVDNLYTAQLQAAIEKNIRLQLNFDTNIPAAVLGDKVRIGQILANLISNAIKFTNTGSVNLTFKLIEQHAEEANIYFEVSDTGIGIPKKHQTYIFDIFSQASNSTTRQFGGTGLGLSISQRLVNLMGGNIEVKSEPGNGSRFYFTLKLKNGKPELINNKSQFVVSVSDSLKNKHILLIEDNPVNVLVVKRFLEKWGILCDVAENGRIGVDMVIQKEYDLVLMDIQMPVMDGYEAATRIRNIGGKYKSLPVIALTASAMYDRKDKILAAGMNDYISKPFKPDELHQKLVFHITRQ